MGTALAIPIEVNDSAFVAVCRRFPDCRVEISSSGEIIVLPPTDPESGRYSSNALLDLGNWNRTHGRGHAVDAVTSYRFPDGSRRSPDASWYDNARWREAKRGTTSRFPVFAPEFVIEVRSPSDSLKNLQRKMEDYMENGVKLGWLIDPRNQTVHIYRPSQTPEVLEHPEAVFGEGPMEGFVLNAAGVFE
jgi:Uma2 family endonuclease